jgi:hypothetical protein
MSKLLPTSLAYICIEVIHMIHDTSCGGIISGRSHAHDTASELLCVLHHLYVPELPEALIRILKLSYTCMHIKFQCVLELLEEPIVVIYAYAFQMPMCAGASGSTNGNTQPLIYVYEY